MAADAWEVRTARLEGAYEQIDRRLDALEARLGSIENRITALDQRIDTRFMQQAGSFAQLRSEMRGQFYWLLGAMLTGFSVMLCGFLALVFRLISGAETTAARLLTCIGR